jgi:hypothetical protein
MEIKWTDEDPATGKRRFLCADRFARVWRFRWKLVRRGPYEGELEPTREMWEHILDGLKRRYQRREGVEEEDIQQVVKIMSELRDLDEDADEPS